MFKEDSKTQVDENESLFKMFDLLYQIDRRTNTEKTGDKQDDND